MPDAHSIIPPANALLLFEDGTEFEGYGIGSEGIVCGELCFNTGMSGYQEILTDPSYHGQIITFTAPHIGNVGCNGDDIESHHVIAARGLIIREPITAPSNWRATNHFNDWLCERDLTGICGIDTRALTTYMRMYGHPKVAIAFEAAGIDEIDRNALMTELHGTASMRGAELTKRVMSDHTRQWTQSAWHQDTGFHDKEDGQYHVVAIDYGAKLNILRLLTHRDCRVTVVPGNASLEEILRLEPDGVFLSNGPGDPSATAAFAAPVIQGLLENNIPLFGICLGHQLLALAMGAHTEKMYQGHRGANHPVKSLSNDRVEITSQNHGFVVRSDGLPRDVEVTHLSLFDGTIEGIRHTKKPAFSVQYHPESSPGPHDSQYLFDQFVEMMGEQH